MVRRLVEELDLANGESQHLSAELAKTTARYKRAHKVNTKTMAEVTTLTGDLEEANLTVHSCTLRNADLMSRLDALKHQLNVTATDKEFLHASTQTDHFPSVVTSPSLVASTQSPPPNDDAPDMPPDGPSEGMVFCTPNDAKSAFSGQVKYKRKLGAVSVTASCMPTTPETPDSETHTPRSQTKELLSQCFSTPKKISPHIVKRLDVNFGIMSAMKSASKSHPEVIPVLQGLMKENVIEKSRLKTSLRTQMGVHNCFGDRNKPERFAPYRKPRKDITCDTLKMKILDFYNSDDQSVMLPGMRDAVKVSANTIGGSDVGDTISIDRIDPLPSSQSSQSNAVAPQSSQSSAATPQSSKKKRKQKEKSIKRQARQLKDYIYNLYERFVFQNPQAPVKSTTFYALRPENIQVVSYIKLPLRNTPEFCSSGGESFESGKANGTLLPN